MSASIPSVLPLFLVAISIVAIVFLFTRYEASIARAFDAALDRLREKRRNPAKS